MRVRHAQLLNTGMLNKKKKKNKYVSVNQYNESETER